jgi:predicted nucleic acid-binding protein
MIVLDASALVVGLTDITARGREVRRRLASSTSVRAPDLVNCETLSALRRLQHVGGVSAAGHRQAITGLSGIAVDRVPTMPFIKRIAELAANVTPYDAAYVALAESLGCPLLTADRRLANAPGPRCDFEVI